MNPIVILIAPIVVYLAVLIHPIVKHEVERRRWGCSEECRWPGQSPPSPRFAHQIGRRK